MKKDSSAAITLNSLRDIPGSRTARKRVGRGVGSGTGKTCGRGQKGQKSRSGVAIKGFEGGQMPIQMRLPKRGFNSRNRKRFSQVNLGQISKALEQGKLDASVEIDEAAIVNAGLVRKRRDGIRVLSDGEISVAVQLSVTGASGPAMSRVEKAGGKINMSGKKDNAGE